MRVGSKVVMPTRGWDSNAEAVLGMLMVEAEGEQRLLGGGKIL